MKRNYLIKSAFAMFLAVALLLSTVGCGTKDESEGDGAKTSSEASGETRTMTDMSGREVEVPTDIERVMTLHPVPTYITWRLAPEKMVNIDENYNKLYIAEDALAVVDYHTKDALEYMRTLPVTSTWMAGVETEEVLKLDPDVIVTLTQDTNADKLQEDTGIPVFCIVKAPVTKQADSYRLMGELLDNEKLGNEMGDFIQGILDRVDAEVSKMKTEDKVTVMFCGKAGDLYGVPGADSVYATTLTAAGGINVSDELEQKDAETIDVTVEQMMIWDPEVIICQTEDERQTLLTGEEWSGLSAVKNKRVYVPLQYTSCDGMKAVLGIEWLNHVLYHSDDEAGLKQLYDDIDQLHEIFYDQTLTQEQLEMTATGW